MYFPFSMPKSGRKRSTHGRRRFIQRFPNMLCNEVQPLALPLGELSPQVTERVVQSFLNNKINLYAHTTKIHLAWPLFPLSVFAALSHLSQRARQGVLTRTDTADYPTVPVNCLMQPAYSAGQLCFSVIPPGRRIFLPRSRGAMSRPGRIPHSARPSPSRRGDARWCPR